MAAGRYAMLKMSQQPLLQVSLVCHTKWLALPFGLHHQVADWPALLVLSAEHLLQ